MDSQPKPSHDPLPAMKRLVIRGTAGAFVVRAIAAVVGLAMNVVLARMLSLTDYGVVALGLSWLTITGTIACFGTDTVALRFVAEGLAKGEPSQVAGVVRWGRRLALTLGVVCALVSIGLLAVVFGDYSAEQRGALWLIVAATPLLAYTLNSASVLRGAKRVVIGAAVEILMRPLGILVLALVLFAVLGPAMGVMHTAAIVVFAQALPALVGAFTNSELVRRHQSPGAAGRSGEWLRIAVPIASMNVMGVLIGNLDTIVIGYFVDADNAGVYRASAQLAGLVAFGLAASNGIVAPLIAELFSSGKLDELRCILRYSVALVSLGSVVGVVTMAFFGATLLGLFGAEYQVGYPVLLILLIGQTINALCGPTGLMMTMTGHQRQAVRIFAVSTAINVALNLLLVPRFGLIGGAIANVAGLSLWNLAILVFLRGQLRLDPSFISWILPTYEIQTKHFTKQDV